MSLSNIRIVLVRTFHPGNIGSAARSMKTMGLSDLALVAPKQFPDPKAEQMAAGAADVLAHSNIYESLPEALRECTAIVAATARPRGFDLPALDPEQTAQHLLAHAQNSKVALVFGPERMGLHNDDLGLVNHRVSIPANPDYSSLNLAAAVQTLSYEIFKRDLAKEPTCSTSTNPSTAASTEILASAEQVSRFHQHLEEVLRLVSFLRPHQGDTLKRVRAIFNQGAHSQAEIQLLRGILTSIQKTVAGEKRPKH